ncbi:phosphatase PAP2 family protein [Defluviimonas sp. WL0002]|uniref:Phosphatase PAP2 family protein n=1 Tax=Albidovulum marisflavi TaxID=2984159 RepID=A0ABT2Z7W2_9RHOB|nr:phosphatase PAP2 family protein [Defluviimonas sp. WL0002]MCV2867168.1 phosphatase PAP2 family protein [Defluviimonas sp. WL0002]
MAIFFRATLVYAIVALLIVAHLQSIDRDFVVRSLALIMLFLKWLAGSFQWGVALPLAAVLTFGLSRAPARLPLLFIALVSCVLFQTAFYIVKSSIPLVVPFYADPWLADFDRWLHGGQDPWVLAHRILDWMPASLIATLYTTIWAFPALAFVFILVLIEADDLRFRRYVILYLFCWLGLGNVLAALGASVGPVFYYALLGDDRFADLHRALAVSGVAQTTVGALQENLWKNYIEGGLVVGSGISAFPSVHVGSTTLVALYVIERVPIAAPPAIAFVALIQILSVYTGYHYAVDGYVSIAAMVGAWALVSPGKRRQIWPLSRSVHKS